MTLPLLNKIAAVGLISIILAAAINIIVTIFGGNKSATAVPITYKVVIVACCWGAIALIGCILYFVIKRHIKA